MEEYDKNVENYAKKLEKPAALLEAFWKKRQIPRAPD